MKISHFLPQQAAILAILLTPIRFATSLVNSRRLVILLIGVIGVQTITSCSDSGGGDDDSPATSNCSLNGGEVTIGNQIWMAENLNCDVKGSRCHRDDPAACTQYGRLYNWATAMALPSSCNSASCASRINAKHKGICPSGWHIPSDTEWDELLRYVDGVTGSGTYTSETAGTKLKATSDWNYYNGESGNGIDEFGFSALPGGYGASGGDFGGVGDYGFWWSSTEGDASRAYRRGMGYNHAYVFRGDAVKSYYLSVRCVKD